MALCVRGSEPTVSLVNESRGAQIQEHSASATYPERLLVIQGVVSPDFVGSHVKERMVFCSVSYWRTKVRNCVQEHFRYAKCHIDHAFLVVFLAFDLGLAPVAVATGTSSTTTTSSATTTGSAACSASRRKKSAFNLASYHVA